MKKLPAQDPVALRQAPRRLVSVGATITNSADGYMPCRVDNLSRMGCRVQLQRRFALDTFVSLTFPERNALGARIVWSDGLRSGLEFLQPLHIAVLDDLLRLFRPPAPEGGSVTLDRWHS